MFESRSREPRSIDCKLASAVLAFIEESQIILQEADLPDIVGDFPYDNELICEHEAELNLALNLQ